MLFSPSRIFSAAPPCRRISRSPKAITKLWLGACLQGNVGREPRPFFRSDSRSCRDNRIGSAALPLEDDAELDQAGDRLSKGAGFTSPCKARSFSSEGKAIAALEVTGLIC